MPVRDELRVGLSLGLGAYGQALVGPSGRDRSVPEHVLQIEVVIIRRIPEIDPGHEGTPGAIGHHRRTRLVLGKRADRKSLVGPARRHGSLRRETREVDIPVDRAPHVMPCDQHAALAVAGDPGGLLFVGRSDHGFPRITPVDGQITSQALRADILVRVAAVQVRRHCLAWTGHRRDSQAQIRNGLALGRQPRVPVRIELLGANRPERIAPQNQRCTLVAFEKHDGCPDGIRDHGQPLRAP